jgi:hypothetical protein
MSHPLYRPPSHLGSGSLGARPAPVADERIHAPMSKQAADKIAELTHQVAQRDKLIDQYKMQIKAYEQRTYAEQLLHTARASEHAPEALKTHSVDSFLSKRAELEQLPVSSITSHLNAIKLLGGEIDSPLFTLSQSPLDEEEQDPWSSLQAAKQQYQR